MATTKRCPVCMTTLVDDGDGKTHCAYRCDPALAHPSKRAKLIEMKIRERMHGETFGYLDRVDAREGLKRAVPRYVEEYKASAARARRGRKQATRD